MDGLPESETPSIPQKSSWDLNRVLVAALVVSVVVLASLGGYYFWLKYSPTLPLQTQKTTSPSQTTSTQTLKGFTKAQSSLTSDKDFIASSRVQLNYQGVIKSMEAGKSWTLDKGGKTVTIKQEGDQEIRYVRSLGAGQREQISEADVKLGDNVSITVFIDTQSSASTVYSITIIR